MNPRATYKSKIPVISIGYIVVGGTGKTPMVIFLADKLQNYYSKIVILSRGYKRKSKGFVIVKDYNSIISKDVKFTGDEPLLIAQTTNNCAVCIDNNRKRGIFNMPINSDELIVIKKSKEVENVLK